MSKADEYKSGLSRRDLLKSAATGMAFTAGAQILPRTAAAAPTGDNPIGKENAEPGTRDWLLTNQYIDPDTWWRSPRIEGYCSEASVSAGDTLKIMVSTNPISEFSLNAQQKTRQTCYERIGTPPWPACGRAAMNIADR